MNDWQLVRNYVDHADESAFTELVRRHVDLVYSAGLRQTGDPHLAKDVTQAVFILFARKARRFGPSVVVPAWLYRAARLITSSTLRKERRRHMQEMEATPMHSEPTDDVLWNQLGPQLDAALARLREADRQAILLRYFSNQSFREVAIALRLGEDAAKKRVARALEKLRALLGRDGRTLTTVALGTLLSSRAVHSAPAGIEAATARAVLTSTAISTSVGEFVAEGARKLFEEQIKSAARAVAAGLAILGVAALLSQGLGSKTPAPPANSPALVRAETSAQPLPGSTMFQASASAAKSIERHLVLRIVDEQTGGPLANTHVKATFYGPRYDRVEEWTDGEGKCRLLFPKKPFEGMAVWVFGAGHVGKIVKWGRSEELLLPVEYTVKLQRGVSIRGVVQDDKGTPVPGVKITMAGPGENPVKRENVSYRDDMAYALSDELGKWTVDFIWKELEGATLYLMHPEFARGEETVRLANAFSDLTFKLSPGIEVSGFVVDTSGEPVGEATIDEETQSFAPELSTRSAPDGYFVFSHFRPGKFRLIVKAAGFGKLDKPFNLTETANDLRLELQRQPVAGHALLRGRVLDENGEPAPNVSVQLSRNQPGLAKILWSTQTDDAGRFVWDSAPDGAANYGFHSIHFQPLENVPLLADGNEQEIRLARRKPSHLRGSVVDALTKQPITKFTVLLGEAHEHSEIAQFRLLGEGTNGSFDLLYGDEPLRGAREILQIEAEGYQPEEIKASTKELPFPGGRALTLAQWEGDQVFKVELQPNRGLSGKVVRSDGSSVPGAQVALSGKGLSVSMQQPGRLYESHINERVRVTRTASDGSFSFKPTLNVERVLVAHTDGWANLSEAEANRSVIMLRPWGRVEGRLFIGSQPGAHLTMNLDPGELSWQATPGLFPFVYEAKTDANGQFEFTSVPPGQCRVSRRHARSNGPGPIGLSNVIFTEVQPGETSTVVIGGRGVTILGKLAAIPIEKRVDWTLNIQRLVPAVLPRKNSSESFQSYDFFCKQDGSFSVPDVSPGDYKLSLRAYAPPNQPDNGMSFGPEIGRLERDVTVAEPANPQAETLLDLGRIEVPITK